jgi:hypothetical protein
MGHIALCLSGQMRTFDHPRVQASFRAFVDSLNKAGHEVDLFVSTWSDRGISYNHGHTNTPSSLPSSEITEEMIRNAYAGLNVLSVSIRNYAEWQTRLRPTYATVLREGFTWNGMQIRGTAVPQLFTIWDANMLRRGSQRTYDWVFRVRPDLMFDASVSIPNLIASCDPKHVHGINAPATAVFWPRRIYDIFFFGGPAAMDVACDAYNNIDAAIQHPFANGLHPRDACRILYVSTALLGNVPVKDVDQVVCDIFRLQHPL